MSNLIDPRSTWCRWIVFYTFIDLNLEIPVWRKWPEIYWQWVSDTQVRNYLVTLMDWNSFRSKNFIFSIIHHFSVTGTAISTVKRGGLFFWGIITKTTLTLMMLRLPENAAVKIWELYCWWRKHINLGYRLPKRYVSIQNFLLKIRFGSLQK